MDPDADARHAVPIGEGGEDRVKVIYISIASCIQSASASVRRRKGSGSTSDRCR